MIAKGKFCKFENQLEAIDAGIRVGFAYTTLGVVSSPIEGYTGIKTGKNSLYDFMRMAESIFLVHTIKKYSPKISIQEFGERKVFVIDNGLLNAVIFQFSANTGKAMEQTVFWELKRRKDAIYFLKNGFECDFITVSAGGIKDIIQVCHDISDPYTLKREVKGITTAAKKLGLKRGTIITYDQQDIIQENEVSINMVPLPIFLCEN